MTRRLIISAAAVLLGLTLNARTEDLTITGSDGKKLSAIIVTPDLKEGQKCPMVILMHGFSGEKDGILNRTMADDLLAEGIASIRFDFNGHGKSEGRFEDMTVPNEIEDAKAVYEYVRALPYVKKIGFVGHSQGGVVASMTAGVLGKKAVKAVVLFAPATILREDAIKGETMGARYNPLDPPESVELFRGLKLGREYIKTAFWLPIYETAAGYKGKAMVFHGTGDTLVPYTCGQRYGDIWKKAEIRLIDGENHGIMNTLKESCAEATAFLAAELK